MMNDKYKYWAIHGGSDSHFAAKNVNDAWELVKMFNEISLEYNMVPSSKVEVVADKDLDCHAEELAIRLDIGDEDYLQP